MHGNLLHIQVPYKLTLYTLTPNFVGVTQFFETSKSVLTLNVNRVIKAFATAPLELVWILGVVLWRACAARH